MFGRNYLRINGQIEPLSLLGLHFYSILLVLESIFHYYFINFMIVIFLGIGSRLYL